MLYAERLQEIRNIIKEKKRVVNLELCEKFGVSDVTIRKDLNILEKEGLINKIHGGAVIKENKTQQIDMSFSDFSNLPNYKTLQKITDIAVNHISDGDTIFLGSGTTCSLLAKKLFKFKGLSVVTNNISAISDLMSFPGKVILIGGEISTVDNLTYFSSLEDPSRYLDNVYVNKAFTSCSGIDLMAGITVNSIISTYMFKGIPDIKRQWFMLVNESKFDKIGIYSVVDLQSLDDVICDKMPEKYKKYFEEKNIAVHTL